METKGAIEAQQQGREGKPAAFRQALAAAWMAAVMLLSPEMAMANPIEEGVDWLLDLLTNGIARSVAIIALAVLGYLAFAGRLSGDLVIKFIVGIVFIFGGASIVDLISSAVQ
ncbi:TrbC/VirB2 family protein (plasmid) [Guyparkeria sp. 1SP6A2]|nr:TrbC/VirB2 family protein [Guyparkeria sp. 1SP6A2]